MSTVDAPAGASFDELLEHLDDLIALAEHDGFETFAHGLKLHRAIMDELRPAYSIRGAYPVTAPDSSLRKST